MFDIVNILSHVFVTLNTILFCVMYRKNRRKEYVFFTIYSCCMMLIEFVTLYYLLNQMNNLYVSHFYFIIQYVLVSLMFGELISSDRMKRFIRYSVIVIPVGFVVQYCLDTTLFYKFNIIEVLVCLLLPVFYAIVFLYKSLDSGNKKWILFTSGLIIYFLSSSVVFSGANYFIAHLLEKLSSFHADFWLINNIIYVIYQLLITIEWFKSFKNTALKR